MADKNYILYVAVYPESSAAAADFRALKEAQDKDFKVDKSVVISREMDGHVEVDQSGTGEVGKGALIGGGAGLALGLFAPPLLLATAVGAGIGALGGEFRKKYEERQLGLHLDDTVPPGSSAIVALIDDKYMDRVERTLTRATRRVEKAVDSGDYEKLEKALSESSKQVKSATES
jgi:uncharacterized membrane protein